MLEEVGESKEITSHLLEIIETVGKDFNVSKKAKYLLRAIQSGNIDKANQNYRNFAEALKNSQRIDKMSLRDKALYHGIGKPGIHLTLWLLRTYCLETAQAILQQKRTGGPCEPQT